MAFLLLFYGWWCLRVDRIYLPTPLYGLAMWLCGTDDEGADMIVCRSTAGFPPTSVHFSSLQAWLVPNGYCSFSLRPRIRHPMQGQADPRRATAATANCIHQHEMLRRNKHYWRPWRLRDYLLPQKGCLVHILPWWRIHKNHVTENHCSNKNWP